MDKMIIKKGQNQFFKRIYRIFYRRLLKTESHYGNKKRERSIISGMLFGRRIYNLIWIDNFLSRTRQL